MEQMKFKKTLSRILFPIKPEVEEKYKFIKFDSKGEREHFHTFSAIWDCTFKISDEETIPNDLFFQGK